MHWEALLVCGAAVLVIGLALLATRVTPYRPVIRHRELVVPASWPKLEILHLSDLHLRRSDPRLLRRQQEALRRLPRQPDVVCVTGDLCERVADAPLVPELLSVLRPRLGTFVILGNHEYDAGAPSDLDERGGFLAHLLRLTFQDALSSGADEGDATGEALRQLGMSVLRNEGVRLDAGAENLWLAGVDSGWAKRADLEAAMRGRRDGEPSLVLVHEPELAFDAAEQGADLVLAGHTHGGQVRLPLFGPPYWHKRDDRLERASGLQPIGEARLHITSGLGQLVPLRFLCPPEAVWLLCVPAPKATQSSEVPVSAATHPLE